MHIRVNGIPAPQGSKTRNAAGALYESSRAVGPWREAVRAETQAAMDRGWEEWVRHAFSRDGIGLPVEVHIGFWLPKPKSAPKSRTWPSKRPDLDKLVRAVLDGLVAGGALADDAQVVVLGACKRYADDVRPPGCDIDIKEA